MEQKYPTYDMATVIQRMIDTGSDPLEVDKLNKLRNEKALNTPGLEKYAYDDFSKKASQYVNNAQQPHSNDVKDIIEILKGTQPYQSQYNTQISDIVNKISGSSFNYDPNNDTSLKTAQNQAIKQNLEAMNDRGILNSTITADRSAQVASNLIPQYEQMAYNRYQTNLNNLYKQAEFYRMLDNDGYNKTQDEVNSLYKRADFINSLNEQEYSKYKDQLEQDYRERMTKYEMEQSELQNQRQKVNDAWSRVAQIGYVDNQASIILGVPVGTPSREVRENALMQEQKIADDMRQIQAQKDRDNRMFSQEIYLTKEREQSNLRQQQANKKATIDYTPEQAQTYEKLIQAFINGKRDAKGDYDYAVSPQGKINILNVLGGSNSLYETLVSELAVRYENEANNITTENKSRAIAYNDTFDNAYKALSSLGEEKALSIIENSGLEREDIERLKAQLGLSTTNINTNDSLDAIEADYNSGKITEEEAISRMNAIGISN